MDAFLDARMWTLVAESTWQTIVMVFLSTIFSMILGLPIGVLLHVTSSEEQGGILPRPVFYNVLSRIVNILRSFPFIILMIVLMPLSRLIIGTSIGTMATVIPLSIAAAPFVARVIESSLKEVDPGVVQAAKAMGSTNWQIIYKVLLPEAMPSLASGVTLTIINLIGYSARQAKAELSSRGLNLGKLIYVNDIATNNVLAQMLDNMEIEPGTPIESESSIDLVVGLSRFDNKTYIPTLYGTKYLSAIDAVHNNSLNIRKISCDNTVKSYNDPLNSFVYRQEPDTSSVTPHLMGSEMTLYFTLDESKIPEPQIDSLSLDAEYGE